MATVIRGKDLDQAAAADMESDIREFVRRDQFAPRRARQEQRPDPRPEQRQDGRTDARAIPLPGAPQLPSQGGHQAPDEINALIRRVSGGSMEEIDRVILELQSVREMLRSEGERVSREISGYASLNTAAMTAMKIIAESMTQWKTNPAPQSNRR